MSEGADSVTQTCGDTTLTTTITASERRDAATGTATPSPSPLPLPPPPPQPTTTTTYTGRRPRFGTGAPPSSPYVWIDGRQLRSALSWTNKWPTRPPGAVPLRVSFPANDNHLVTGYLEPANPWRHAENVNREDLIFSYKESCARHNTEPLLNVLVQLKNLDISQDRCEQLNLKGEILNQDHSEPLEEILKRVQFNKINLERTSLNDESSVILFDMLEYYESAKHLNISFNPEIGARGWQACSHMIKKTQCLEQLEARDITFNEQNMNILSRALRLVCHLHVLKLENCGLSGRAVVILVTALKMNSGIRELYLADNGLDLYDAIQLGSLLRMNNHLQLLDISNNNVQDDGVRDILEGLINQVNEDKTGRGLSILILWNNRLTKNSSPYFSRIIALSKTLETLNIGQNMLTDETLRIVNESLKQNRVLLQLGMQSTELTCEGIITLAEIMETNQVLQRIDLRDNSIQMRGMCALANVMKMNKTVTQIDLDDKPRIRIDGPLHEYVKLIAEIRGRCGQNEEERRLLEESTEDAESPQHPSRILNASSRKISLTCQTLPSPSSGRSATSLAADEPATRATLEPAKRTSGGRLRSPAPSPIPSPVASPIPSPSRNRFVVCRVPEASLRSTDSSASTSPVTPPSLGSSPNFFPSASSSGGPSRFRVSVVESTGAGRSSPKSVVASTSGSSITIGFNVRIDAADSDDADSVIDKTDASGNTAASASVTLHVVPSARETSSPSEVIAKNEDCCVEETKTPSSEQQVKERLEIDEIVTAIPEDECEKMTEIKEEEQLDQNYAIGTSQSEKTEVDYCGENGRNRSNVTMDSESVATADRDTEAIIDRRIVYTSTKELQVPAYPNEDTLSISVVGDKASNAIELSLDNTSELNRATSEELSTCMSRSSASTTCTGTSSTRTTELHSREQPSTSVQKHKSSLERLLSLFQHPGQFFSDSSSAAVDTRSSLQENVSGVMALGDRLQQYLKEGRTKTDGSSEHGSPLKNKSMGLNISQLQNLTGIFASFKLESQASLVEHGAKFFGQMKNQDTNIREKNLEESVETEVTRVDDEGNLLDRENNQLARNDGNSLIEQDEVIKNGENNLFDQKKNHSTKDDEKDLVAKEKIIGRDENLFGQENSQIPKNDEQKLFDQISRDDGKDFSQEESQVSNSDENKLFIRMENQTIEIERNLEDREKGREIVRNVGENFQGSEDTQGRDEVAYDDSEDERLRNDIARNDGKDSASVRDGARDVDEKEDARSADDLRTESDRISDRLLPESVQSKDDFADNLVLGGVRVATNAAAISSSLSPASESTACINVRLTDVAAVDSALGLSKIADVCVESNDAKRFEDFIGEEERDDVPQDSKRTERDDDAECIIRADSEILGNNDAKCLQRDDDAVEETNAATIRTCDTTTDSINQTSDSRFFSISNIAYDSKEAVDSVSIASITTDDDVDVIRSVPGKNGGPSSTSSTSSKDASVYLNEEVTSNTCRDRRCDFTKRREGEDLHDDACRDSVDRATSTSVNINLDPHGESETTSPDGNQEAPGRRLFMPNNVDEHRIILETAANTSSHPEDDDDDERSKRMVDPTILVIPSPHETSLDKSDAEELIFCMTDVSTDGTSIEDELSPQGVAPKSSPNKLAESYFELLPASRTIVPTSSNSSTLLIETPGSVHRNSQDSGIEETALTIDETGMAEMPSIPPPPPPPPPRSSLQESVDSGIESECSSICIRMESAGISTLEIVATPKRSARDDNDDDDDDDEEEFGEFASDFLARETRLVDSDSTSGDGDGGGVPYLKCAIVDEGVARSPAPPMIAHSPAAVHGTSPK